jgi:aspartate aminotransferase-like enzyme
MTSTFLTGPVAVSRTVRAAFSAQPVSHRDPAFMRSIRQTREQLASLTGATHVQLLVGSGTLANDAVAAQLTSVEGAGLVLTNGEFGDRLIDHARRWRLEYAVERRPWGAGFDWEELRSSVERLAPAWIWAALTETSTGVTNPLHELSDVCERAGAALCIDAVSAIGLSPVDLRGVRFATAVSGKGLAAYPGIAAVFHDGHLANPAHVPRYLDLSVYEQADGVPFTHSSNLIAALECSLAQTDWPRKWRRVAEGSRQLHAELRQLSLPPLASQHDAAAGVLTIRIPPEISTPDVACALRKHGIEIAWQSPYLIERNWMQIALMGEIDHAALASLPAVLASCVAELRTCHRQARPRAMRPHA